jgi:hypothetical protein
MFAEHIWLTPDEIEETHETIHSCKVPKNYTVSTQPSLVTPRHLSIFGSQTSSMPVNNAKHSLADAFGVQRWLSKIASGNSMY